MCARTAAQTRATVAGVERATAPAGMAQSPANATEVGSRTRLPFCSIRVSRSSRPSAEHSTPEFSSFSAQRARWGASWAPRCSSPGAARMMAHALGTAPSDPVVGTLVESSKSCTALRWRSASLVACSPPAARALAAWSMAMASEVSFIWGTRSPALRTPSKAQLLRLAMDLLGRGSVREVSVDAGLRWRTILVPMRPVAGCRSRPRLSGSAMKSSLASAPSSCCSPSSSTRSREISSWRAARMSPVSSVSAFPSASATITSSLGGSGSRAAILACTFSVLTLESEPPDWRHPEPLADDAGWEDRSSSPSSSDESLSTEGADGGEPSSSSASFSAFRRARNIGDVFMAATPSYPPAPRGFGAAGALQGG
mmetsp:Transcript_7150/g.20717  ORF Transcript_7150/g.20717 Transcript_7150/m.20717 type:complete len:369 (+) Transcript_7150:2327-3433(+)